VKPPVENGSSILQPKITQHPLIVCKILDGHFDNAFERGVRIGTNRASGINVSVETRCAVPKSNAGKRPSGSRDGEPMPTIVFGKLIESGCDVNRNANRLRTVNFHPQ
jgi:hypothetical protein